LSRAAVIRKQESGYISLYFRRGLTLENLKKAPCTVVLLAINIIIFFALTMFGATEDSAYMLEHGAMYVPYLTQNQEYYRIFTSMFLHYGFDHLMGNMVILGLLGWQLEQELGSVKYIILYLVSGLGGQFAMIYYDIFTKDYAPFAGASGAIFGVIGALLYVAVRNKGRVGKVSGPGLLVMIVISVYYGFTNPGIANFAHIGSLISGFLLAILLYRKRNRKSSSVARD